MKSDYEILKDNYGERFAKMCRDAMAFKTVLDIPGLLSDTILASFAPNKYLYDDLVRNDAIDSFALYIYSILKEKKLIVEEKFVETDKSVRELFAEKGYDFYECHSEEDIQKFRKYYASGEELCTFNGGRLDYCHVFWVVKKNVNEIKRENFNSPMRQDEYGTSVMSIQFERGAYNFVSIKNRYNHIVPGADSTFGNDLDSINPGLKHAFEREYGLKIRPGLTNKDTMLPGYVLADDGKYYKFNYSFSHGKDRCCYCPDGRLIINGKVQQLDRERYIIADYFIIDLKEKKIELFPISGIDDSLVERFKNIKRIEIKKEKTTKNKEIKIVLDNDEEVIIRINKLGQIISYRDDYVKELKENFFIYSKKLMEASFANLERVGNNFLPCSFNLFQINLPKLKSAGNNFLAESDAIEEVSLPELETVGDDFLKNAWQLRKLNANNLKVIGDDALVLNRNLKSLNLNNLLQVGNNFMSVNQNLKQFYCPKLVQAGNNFLNKNKNLTGLKRKIKLIMFKKKILDSKRRGDFDEKIENSRSR